MRCPAAPPSTILHRRAASSQRDPADPDAAHAARDDARLGGGPARCVGAERPFGNGAADRLPHGIGLPHGLGPGAARRATFRRDGPRRRPRAGFAAGALSAADRNRQGGNQARRGP